MKTGFAVCTMQVMFAAVATAQQPVIIGLFNNYSFVEPGLPHYGIARGSIFAIIGLNLARVPSLLQSVPLPMTLNQVSAKVTVGGVTIPLILYFALPGQIAAILPSSTPLGIGQLTVTNNAVPFPVSEAFPIQVVQSAFGILTLSGAGSGPAAVFNAASRILGPANSVNPGEYITIWGSGLGPVTGDETQLQTSQDLTSIPIEVHIGGLPATVSFHGRSVYPGLDQINVVVPSAVQAGCRVSVVVRTGDIVSNFGAVPIAAAGRTCSDSISGVSAAQLQKLGGQFSYAIGFIDISKDVTTTAGATAITTVDSASAEFIDALPTIPFDDAQIAGLKASLGSCQVYGIDPAGNIGFSDVRRGTLLDAGSALNVAGPNGTAMLKPTVTPQSFYLYGANFSTGFIPTAGGTFTFDHIPNDPESADLKAPIGAKITLPPALTWTNQSRITTVNRSQGVTVSWSGGDPGTYVTITGSAAEPNSVVGSYFTCSAPISAGTFTVPSAVLLSLPPTSGATPNSFLRVANRVIPQTFAMSGLDIGLISGGWSFTRLLNYQ